MLSVTFATQAAEDVSLSEVSRDIKQLLNSEEPSILGVEILTRDTMLEVYQDHGFAPYWTDPARVRELMELINDSADHGLKPSDYNISQLKQILQQRLVRPDAEIEAETDILLTESLFRYAYHRRYGKIKASSLDPDINFKRETFKHRAPAVNIEQALASSSLTDFIQLVAPTSPVYRHLQARMKLYREIASRGVTLCAGWPHAAPGGHGQPRREYS